MIYIKIGSQFIFTSYIWDDWKSSKWSVLSSKKWSEVLINTTVENTELFPLANTLNINDLVNDQSTAYFNILDMQNTCDFKKGQPVTIWDENFNIIFSGFVDNVIKKHFGSGSLIGMENTVTCIDNHYLVNKRRLWTSNNK